MIVRPTISFSEQLCHQQTAAQRHDHRIMQEGKLLIRTVNDLRAKSFDVLLRRRG